MRTVIFMGLLAIADALSESWISPKTAPGYAAVFISAIVMDVFDFLKTHRKN